MKSAPGEIDKIIGTDYFRFPSDLHRCLSFQDKEGLFQVRMDMGVGLTPIFNLPENNFHAFRPAGSRTEEAAVGRFGMARRGVGRNILQMCNIFFHRYFIPRKPLARNAAIWSLGTMLSTI